MQHASEWRDPAGPSDPPSRSHPDRRRRARGDRPYPRLPDPQRLVARAVDIKTVIERLNQTFRPDLAFDWNIHEALGLPRPTGSDVPRYTGSLDAALSLVPEGMNWAMSRGRMTPDEPWGCLMLVDPETRTVLSAAEHDLVPVDTARRGHLWKGDGRQDGKAAFTAAVRLSTRPAPWHVLPHVSCIDPGVPTST